MLRIYKYPFEVQGELSIEMPKGASILTVQVQNGTPCIWAVVNDSQLVLEDRRFRLFSTGQHIDVNLTHMRYIGTFQLVEGTFVGHLFEAGRS